jgi:hypothetical protein
MESQMNFEINLRGQQVTDEALLKDLIEAHAVLLSLKKKMSKRLYDKFGKFSSETVASRFGSWNDALLRAGLPITEQKNISAEKLFKNIAEVWITNGHQPTYRDISKIPSKFTASTYSDRFGSWNSALLAFSDYMRSESPDSNAPPNSGKVFLENNTNDTKKIKRTKRDISYKLRFSILLRDGFRCMSCGRSPVTTPGVELHIDHIQPWSEGGETIPENLQTKCKNCNLGKGNAFTE